MNRLVTRGGLRRLTLHMGYAIKKIAVSGTISATIFAVFLYFVYNAESAKNNTATTPKQYTADAVARANDIVAQTTEQARIGKTPAIAPSAVPSIPAAKPAPFPIAVPTVTSIPALTAPSAQTPAPAPVVYYPPQRTVTPPRTTVS